MCVGIDGGEMSKDEIVGVLSGVTNFLFLKFFIVYFLRSIMTIS